jgi:NB-ARC domain/SEFIR domain
MVSGDREAAAGRQRRKVFVSYAYDSPAHVDDVLRLVELLQTNGSDIWIDKQVAERVGWGEWTGGKIEDADYVLAIASPAYRQVGDGRAPADEHRGVRAELALLRELQQADWQTWTRKILPVLLPGRSEADVPRFLYPHDRTHYRVTDFTVEGADALIRLLTDQPNYRMPEPGEAPHLPPRQLGPRVTLGDGATSASTTEVSVDSDMGMMSSWTRFAVVDHEQLFGIDNEVERLGTLLGNQDGAWIISIFGTAGAGKTTLAYELVKRHGARTGYGRIAWVSAKSTHLTSLGEIERERRADLNWRDLLLEIAAQLDLGVSPNPMTVDRELPRALALLGDGESCLIVIDNLETVPDARTAIQFIAQESLIRPHKVILTTRESAIQFSRRVHERRWEGLEPEAARRFAEHLGRDDPSLDLARTDLDEIVVTSGGVPLLIKLIVRLAIFKRLPINQITMRLHDKRTDLGASVGEFLYEQSLSALESRVGGRRAEKLMNVFCAKVGGESFTADKFYRLSRIADRARFQEALEAASQLALVRSIAGNTRFTVHSLLREFVCG